MRFTKKLLAALLVLAMLLSSALALTAWAENRVVATDKAKVFNKNTKKSDIISRLPKGITVDVFDTKGDWMHIHYINKKGVEKTGWIRAKDLKEGGGQTSSDGSHKHNWTEWRVTKKPTCTKAGRKEHTCTICGVTKEKEVEKAKHTWGKWTVTRAATCNQAGEKVHKCSVCGAKGTKKIEKSAHQFSDWNVDQAATCSEQGSRSRTCSVCGAKETEVIEKLAHSFGPWTMTTPMSRISDGERTHACTVCGMEERESVKAEPGFARKDRGDGVKAVQEMLNELGYDAGKADGSYGPKLDKAFESFARDKGVSFATGWLMPAQLDALVSGWVEAQPDDKWMGVRDGLTLTVDPAESDDGLRSFNWILSNDNKETLTLRAVLMAVGSDHNFRSEDMVAVLDAQKLKTGTANALGGTFTIPGRLGEGDVISFAAVLENEKGGEVWLSNTVNCPQAQ